MIFRIVYFALHNSVVVYIGGMLLVAAGLFAMFQLDIEAYPNPVPPLVEIIAQPFSMCAEETERFVTIPLEAGLFSIKGISHIRSQSLFGLSDIKCYFDWETVYQSARQEVINRLQFIPLPANITASISPWNAIGEVFRYIIEGPGYSLTSLKSVQDWILARQWPHVQGVIDVTSFGGMVKTYGVEINPYQLVARQVSYNQMIDAITQSNVNTGGGKLNLGDQAYDVRGIGLIKNTHDIENIVIRPSNDPNQKEPILVKDVATVATSFVPRLGKIGQNDQDDVVQGVVLMNRDAQTPAVLAGIKERINIIERNHLLPPGVTIKPYYDRGDLVQLTTHTVMENMCIGILLVSLTLFFFLSSVKAALITALNIPLALFVAFIGLVSSKSSANLISLGAVDFGIVVDSTVIMVENIFHHLGPTHEGSMRERVLKAASEVARPLGYSTAIVAVSFLPLFTMTGVSGVIFAPMARTYAMSIFGAIVCAVTLTPVLMTRFVAPNLEEKENFLLNFLHKLYDPLFEIALKYPTWATLVRIIPIGLCVILFPLLGQDFMPKLEEGNLWIRATLPPSVSFAESGLIVQRMRRIVRGCPINENLPCRYEDQKHPEVKLVQSQMGRPDDGTDVTGFFNIEMFVPLIPFGEFPRGQTKETLINTLQTELDEYFPGIVFNFSQMISDNVEEAVAGVKGENSVKIFGPNVVSNEAIADQIVKALKKVPGITDLGLFRTLGQPGILITPDRQLCAHYNLNTADVDQVIALAVGGLAVTQVLEDEKRFDLVLRLRPNARSSLQELNAIPIPLPEGGVIALGQIAKITTEDAALTIYREDGERYAPVKFSVRNRDLAGAIAEAKKTIHNHIDLPFDTHLVWSGAINELHQTQQRLMLIVPLSLLLISLLVFVAVGSLMNTLIVLIDIPVACTGGLLALMISGQHFSVSAAMGFVSIFGIAIQDAIIVVTYFQQLFASGRYSVIESARQAAKKRFRPVLMTTLVATLGLLPAALSNAIGAQTQRPLALVVIGGSLMVALLTRILQPTLLVLVYQHRLPPASQIES